MKRIIISSLLFAYASITCAGEVNGVFGFKFNEAFLLPACKLGGDGRHHNVSDVTCVQPARNLSGYDQKIRRIVLSYNESSIWLKSDVLYAFEKNGKLVGVMFYTKGYETQDMVNNVLSNKFGHEPETVTPYVLQDRFGREYSVSFKTWYADNSVIANYNPAVNIYNSSLNDLDEANVIVETEAGREYRESIKTKVNKKSRSF
ncbi:hypothetical protein [Stutzerimonas nitrititolerans]|uniref:hypothetical protein n=1 Tax=Stutzerimonas nitrititolerans TaxID=2482751 RepID=UPI00289A824F|nr:hypothetical protein [Stutzerimonas nitrititolerans]